MKFLCLLIVVGLSCRVQAQDPGAYRWKKRVVLLFEGEALARQQTLLEKCSADLQERDLVVLVVKKDDLQLRRKYDVKPREFTLLLLGKDGGEKFRSLSVVEPARIFAIIDAMPMRREEMAEKRRLKD